MLINIRNAQLHSCPGRGYGLQPILEGLNIWSADSSTWKFVPFCDGSVEERIFGIIYVRFYICIHLLCD